MSAGPSKQGEKLGASTADIGSPTDQELLARIATDRDKTAFAMLFERYGSRIKGYMIKAGADGTLAEEAAQEAMLAVWRKAALFDPARASAPAWIFAIARNKRIDIIRRSARYEPLGDMEPAEAPDGETEPAAESTLADRQRDELVKQALTELGEDQRAVVRLAFYEGLAHSEIAEALSLPLGTVKSRLRLAFGKLRAVLGAEIRDELLDG